MSRQGFWLSWRTSRIWVPLGIGHSCRSVLRDSQVIRVVPGDPPPPPAYPSVVKLMIRPLEATSQVPPWLPAYQRIQAVLPSRW